MSVTLRPISAHAKSNSKLSTQKMNIWENKSSVKNILITIFILVLIPVFHTRSQEGNNFPIQDQDNRKDGVTIGSDPFPIPNELLVQVSFWLLIYTKYTTREGLIHDQDDVSIIYDVVRFGSFDGRSNKKLVSYFKNKYERILNNLANRDPTTEEEERVYNLFSKNRSRERFRQATSNIRFQLGQRDRFMAGLIRSGAYVDEIRRILKSYNLPEDIAALPLVESSFNIKAYSKFGAAGIWQFIRSTGKKYLKIGDVVDERLDPIAATDAAAKLLTRNYDILKAWPLAITAYNHGCEGMQRAVSKLGTRDIVTIIKNYDGRRFGFASRNFYTEFLAAREAAKNAERYFGEIERDKPFQYTTFKIRDFVPINTISRYFGMEIEEISNYNPSLRPPVLKGQKYIPRDFELKIPEAKEVLASNYYRKIPEAQKFKVQRETNWYKVKRGDSLSKIASRFHTTKSSIKKLNFMTKDRIYIGQLLKIPGDEGSQLFAHKEKSSESKKENNSDLLIVNNPKENSKKEEIRGKSQGEPLKRAKYAVIKVEPNETLGHYAEWLSSSVAELKRINKIKGKKSIILGQKIKIPLTRISIEEFEKKRSEYHGEIEEDFWLNYTLTETTTYTVKKNDKLWEIYHNKFDIPLWLLKQHNPDVNLAKIQAGQKLVIPVVAEKKK